jgi:hypothetical protein
VKFLVQFVDSVVWEKELTVIKTPAATTFVAQHRRLSTRREFMNIYISNGALPERSVTVIAQSANFLFCGETALALEKKEAAHLRNARPV